MADRSAPDHGREDLYRNIKAVVKDNVVQEARQLIEHLKAVNNSPGGGETLNKASKSIHNLIVAYKRKCDIAERSERDAQFAAKSMLSFQQLGSQNNWPVSHQYSACKETLQYLSDENTYLRQQLAARADTKFVKGILQCSVKNVQLVQIQPETDQTQHCIELETERVHLKHEIYSLRATLNAHYPGAMTVQFLENQLASETRLREYQAIQHDTVHKKLVEQSQDMKQLGEAVAGLAKQNHSLLSAINTKSSASQLGAIGSISASESPTIAAGTSADQHPFGPPRATFDPRLTGHHHHAQRTQSDLRTHHQPQVYRVPRKSPRPKHAPGHESRINHSPEHRDTSNAQGCPRSYQP